MGPHLTRADLARRFIALRFGIQTLRKPWRGLAVTRQLTLDASLK
jgi:hypothetical protein